jgi:tetratricopeptide (TPR) repeat protein
MSSFTFHSKRGADPLVASVTAPFGDRALARLARSLEPIGLDFEIAFFERAMRRDPRSEPILEALGHAYTQRGRLEEGLAVDLRLAELRPGDPIVHYNLACSYSLLGAKDDGIRSLGRAIELGYDDLEHLEGDRDLDAIRGDARFEDLVKKIR